MKSLPKYKLIRFSDLMAVFVTCILLTGCKLNKYDVNFKVNNFSSTDILVEYVDLLNNNDTNIVQIAPSEIKTISTTSQVMTDDWFWVNNFAINYIINLSGDTIKFNPNASYYWVLSEKDYILDITNTSF